MTENKHPDEDCPDDEDLAFDEFFEPIITPMRVLVARGLLKNNDTQCFTTEQYERAYRSKYDTLGERADRMWRENKVARRHLLDSCSSIVFEASPDVWAAKPGLR